MLKTPTLLTSHYHKISPPYQFPAPPATFLGFSTFSSFTTDDTHIQVEKIQMICLRVGYSMIVFYVFSLPEAAGIDCRQK